MKLKSIHSGFYEDGMSMEIFVYGLLADFEKDWKLNVFEYDNNLIAIEQQ